MTDQSERGTPTKVSFVAHDGRLNYACLRPDERHFATSTLLLHDCLWHGSECDDWNLLIPAFAAVVASDSTTKGGTDG